MIQFIHGCHNQQKKILNIFIKENNMRTLIISIYDSGWEFNAASLSNLDYCLLDDDNTNELYNIYLVVSVIKLVGLLLK